MKTEKNLSSNAKSDCETSMRQSLMRGLCALNLETLNALNEEARYGKTLNKNQQSPLETLNIFSETVGLDNCKTPPKPHQSPLEALNMFNEKVHSNCKTLNRNHQSPSEALNVLNEQMHNCKILTKDHQLPLEALLNTETRNYKTPVNNFQLPQVSNSFSERMGETCIRMDLENLAKKSTNLVIVLPSRSSDEKPYSVMQRNDHSTVKGSEAYIYSSAGAPLLQKHFGLQTSSSNEIITSNRVKNVVAASSYTKRIPISKKKRNGKIR